MEDGLFRLQIDAWLRRREETNITAVEKPMGTLLYNRGQHSVQGTILWLLVITEFRGYGHPSILETISGKGFSYLFNIPYHLLSVHPFVA